MPIKKIVKRVVLATSIFIGLHPLSTFAASQASDVPAPGGARSITGLPGRADAHATVNFSKVARQPLAPLAPVAAPAPRVMPLPSGRPVPTEALGRWQETTLGPATLITGPSATAAVTPGPSANFLAMNDSNFVIPPDVHGAAGPNHLMVTLNSHVRIQNRTGGVISTVRLSAFWSSLNNPNAPNPFDPKVLYDPYVGRWIFTSCADPRLSTSSVLIGVSQTSDPTGNWNLYRVDVDAANRLWADYPSIGFNKNWIVVNVNMFTLVNDTFIRSDNFAFNKADLYAGGTGLFTRLMDTTGGGAIAPAITYDTTVSTMYLLEDWNGNAGSSGFLRLSTITGSVGSEVYHPGVAFPSSPSTWSGTPSTGAGDFAPQLGSAHKIACNDSRMQNTVYRNGSLWCTQTVFLPASTATRAAVQWWNINAAGSVLQRGRVDDATGTLFYAFPSIAVNKNSSVLLGYSRFSANQYASGNYAYRTTADPANTLRNDTVLKAGEASYFKTFGGGSNRWGDYTESTVDPTNDADMWTIQEYAALPSAGTDRWGTWWGRVADPSDACASDTVKPVVTCPANISVGNTPGQCAATVSYTATATDNCPGVTLVCTPASGSSFSLGTTPVKCIATDAANNKDSCTFTVTVSDTQKPAIACPANLTVFRSPTLCDTVPASFSATASDNCPGVTLACTPPSGSFFPLGVSNVLCVATDNAGNKDSCSFTVTVLKGDMNGDATLSPADAVLLLNCIFLATGSCNVCVADLNCNGQLSPADAVVGLNAVFLGIHIPCTP